MALETTPRSEANVHENMTLADISSPIVQRDLNIDTFSSNYSRTPEAISILKSLKNCAENLSWVSEKQVEREREVSDIS